jgi:FtsZ-binding cell division protein ZapB|tara:strand:+ start:84 stop:563 length:480 start_codon:yes stop_codon:yes gene_type:complete
MIKIYLLLIIMGVIGAVGYGGYMYYKDTQQRIATLTDNNAKLEVAVQISEDSVELLQDDITKNAELNRELQKELQVAEKYGDQLRNTLRKHNLTHLANKKPGLIERKMQNATNRLWNDLADITNPNGVQSDARTKGGDGNKDSKNGSADSSKTKASSAK